MNRTVRPLYVLVTAAMNEEAFIEQTIRSVVNQTVQPVKWAIVSDGSTDRTDAIVAAYAKKWKYIQLVRREKDQYPEVRLTGPCDQRGL